MFKNRLFLNPEKIRAIFFDFDGVILESVDVKTQAFRLLFSEYPQADVDQFIEYHLRHGGVSRMEKITYFYKEILNQPLSQTQHQMLCDRFRELALENVLNAPFVPGALEYLQNESHKFECYLISGTPQDELREIVQKRNLTQYFREILGAPIKKTEHVRNLLATYSYKPEQVVFVGDSMTDFDAALSQKLLFISI